MTAAELTKKFHDPLLELQRILGSEYLISMRSSKLLPVMAAECPIVIFRFHQRDNFVEELVPLLRSQVHSPEFPSIGCFAVFTMVPFGSPTSSKLAQS